MVHLFPMLKKWNIAKTVDQAISDKFTKIQPIVLQLLINRGLDTQEKIDKFLNPDYEDDLYDPFLFIDMEKAVNRIFKAIENKEKIIVYGDYDADGVCSSAVMMEILKIFGADVDIYIPYRETEGYGLNAEAVTKIAENGADLVITVDCGISNIPEAKILKDKKVDLIITDHHHEPEGLPDAYAIINPNVAKDKYPFGFLTGVGVAYKVAQGLVAKHKDYKVKELEEGEEKWLLDLVAIGTVADLMPVLSENRVLVKYGLIVLEKTRRVGLIELIEKLGNRNPKIDERVIGWQIAPRLNAAGRLNHASVAYELLTTTNKTRATELSEKLNKTNRERQGLTEKIITEAKDQIGEPGDKKLLSAVGKNWPTGVVGLVAGKISDRNNLPSLIISEFEGKFIGSGRSIPVFNMIEAMEKAKEYLSKFGGHSQACGFTIKDNNSVQPFLDKMAELSTQALAGKDTTPTLEIDAEINLEDIDWPLYKDIEKFEPFGAENPKPRFTAKDLTVADLQTMGKDNKHLRLMVQHNTDAIFKTVGFSFGYLSDKLNKGDKVDIVFEVDINEWNGSRELQLKIIDLEYNK